MKSKIFKTDKLIDMIDLEVRNVQIVTSWDILTLLTKMKYSEKISYLCNEYFLSDKAIQKILKQARDL